jgi:UDP-galactopyranose mutase
MRYDFVIVGAGFAGSVCAERLASAGHKVLVLDRRTHVGGNAYDTRDAHGLLIHPYGPHIFHTNSKRIFEYLSRFTTWRFYEHRVLAYLDGELYPFPINRTTLNRLYSLTLDEKGAAAFFEKVALQREPIKTSEDLVLSSVGSDLCEKFFRNYTRKQWGLDLSELAAGVAARISARVSDDDRYFSDQFQFMPANGYANLFRAMLDHLNIEVMTGVEFRGLAAHGGRQLIYTGPIDAYFGYCFGKLPYRSLRFEHEHHSDCAKYQATGQVNYPNDYAYTRITEFRHLTGEVHSGTSIAREFPQDEGDPFYPVPRAENEALFQKYKALADAEENTLFVGRLAEYRYYNMDQVVGAALAAADGLICRTH